MGGEQERQGRIPSFTGEGAGTDSQVDLEQLLNEIDQSMAVPPPSPELPQESEPAEGSPLQSMLDFGGSEQTYGREGGEPPLVDDKAVGVGSMSRGVLMAGGALMALSLLCGVVGLYVAFGAAGRIEALQQSVEALQTKLATLQVSGDPRVGQLQAEQTGLASRLDELTEKLEAAAAPATGGEGQLAELRKRLDALERKASQPVSNSTKSTVAKPAAKGDWTVILVSFPSTTQAQGEQARLQKLGLHAEVFKSQVEGKTWYRVRVPGYLNQDAAKAAIPALEKKSGISGAWVAHR